jgi:hypothetical protein
MNIRRFLQQVLGVLFAVVLLAACNASTHMPAPAPTFPPPPPPTFHPPPPSPNLTSVPTPRQQGQPTKQAGLFRFIRTVQVAPDEEFSSGAFVRVNYLPAIDRFVVSFGTRHLPQTPAGCQTPNGIGYVYKEYDSNMNQTGKSGIINCLFPDYGAAIAGSHVYFVSMRGGHAWQIAEYDATNWSTLASFEFPLDASKESSGDPMLAYVNGQIDICSAYLSEGVPPGTGSHHEFFTPDLQFVGKRILTDVEHGAGSAGGAYMVYVDNVYHFVTSSRFDGDVIVLRYDQSWNFLGSKTLVRQAHFPTGAVSDGERFFVAYLDTSQRTTPGFLPVYLNVHLAAFDDQWNLIDDVAVTNYTPTDSRQPGRPWVTLHGNRLYVAYDLGDESLPTVEEGLDAQQAYVSIYELATP